MIDIVTIGAGGGSIARVSDTGALIVGPQSAGAVPGPVCYGRGGVEPTVTDAHLALGHLPPYLLGGSFALYVEAARVAIRRRVAEPLGMTVEAAHPGHRHNNMLGPSAKTVERGHDPRFPRCRSARRIAACAAAARRNVARRWGRARSAPGCCPNLAGSRAPPRRWAPDAGAGRACWGAGRRRALGHAEMHLVARRTPGIERSSTRASSCSCRGRAAT
jgi:hypothetical protein